jgi:hypothetical protein
MSPEMYFSYPVMSTTLLAHVIFLDVTTLTSFGFYKTTRYEFPQNVIFLHFRITPPVLCPSFIVT